ncbi:MAG: hypothetical protein HY962_17005, partial [Ignavibacteriae bacterium]|nr:hypothetical protein [Ignavibacteriota bacterium]
MRKLFVFAALLLALVGVASAQTTVKVTFLVNTSTVPDTLHPDKAVVQVRGDTPPLQWNGSTGITLTNIGGDLWTGTYDFPANDTIQYKFFTNAVSATGDNEHKGWENDILPDGNRVLITGTSPIVLPMEFVNGSGAKQLQNWKPWNTGADSIAVRIRVNMQGWQAFNAANDRVGARGAAWPGYLGNL